MKNNDFLIGEWVISQDDMRSIRDLGHVMITFSDKGILTYKVLEEESDQVIIMTFEVYKDKIVTNQPSSPKIESTNFRFEKDTLILEFNGEESRFIRFKDG